MDKREQFQVTIVTRGNELQVLHPIVENCKTFGGTMPSHLSCRYKKTTGQVQRAITRSQIALTVNELLIIEFYSRKGKIISGLTSFI